MELGFVENTTFLLLIFIYLTRAFHLIPLEEYPDDLIKWIGDPEAETARDILHDGGYAEVPYGEPITCEELHSPEPMFEEELPDPTMSDPNHFQGDIRANSMDELLWMMGKIPLSDSADGTYRSAFLDYRKRWPNNTIPYIISNAFDLDERRKIGRALQAYHTYTCIRFRPMVPQRDQNWIHIKKGRGCYSFIGMGDGEQPVSLGPNCVQHGVILHELMHVVGFYHEQMRYDRDNFVSIDLSNVKPKFWVNFGKNSIDNSTDLGLPYDFSSVMHYKRNSFGPGSIESKPPNIPFGQRKGFSRIDVQGIAKLYGCDEPVFGRPTSECKDKDPWLFCKDQIQDLTCYNPIVAEKCKKSCGLCDFRHQYCESQPSCGLYRNGKCRLAGHCWLGEVQENSGQNPCSGRSCICCETGFPHQSCESQPSCGLYRNGKCRLGGHCWSGEVQEYSGQNPCSGRTCICCETGFRYQCEYQPPCGSHHNGKCRSGGYCWSGEMQENSGQNPCSAGTCICCVTVGRRGVYLGAEIKLCIAPKTPCGTLKQGMCRPYKCNAGEFPSPVASCEGTNCKCCKPKTELCSAPGQSCGPYSGGKCRSACMYWERADNCKACHCPGRHCQCCYASTYSSSSSSSSSSSNDLMQNHGYRVPPRRTDYRGKRYPIWALLGTPKKNKPSLEWLNDDDDHGRMRKKLKT